MVSYGSTIQVNVSLKKDKITTVIRGLSLKESHWEADLNIKMFVWTYCLRDRPKRNLFYFLFQVLTIFSV